jgi:hypothetical protein
MIEKAHTFFVFKGFTADFDSFKGLFKPIFDFDAGFDFDVERFFFFLFGSNCALVVIEERVIS